MCTLVYAKNFALFLAKNLHLFLPSSSLNSVEGHTSYHRNRAHQLGRICKLAGQSLAILACCSTLNACWEGMLARFLQTKHPFNHVWLFWLGKNNKYNTTYLSCFWIKLFSVCDLHRIPTFIGKILKKRIAFFSDDGKHVHNPGMYDVSISLLVTHVSFYTKFPSQTAVVASL